MFEHLPALAVANVRLSSRRDEDGILLIDQYGLKVPKGHHHYTLGSFTHGYVIQHPGRCRPILG
jgi:hypothetical protein